MDVRSSGGPRRRTGTNTRAKTRSLARGSDRLEALLLVLLVIAGFVTIGLGIWLGDSAADGVRRSELEWRAGGYPAVAVATEVGPLTPSLRGDGLSAPRQVSVRWTAPDGNERRGEVVLSDPVEAGAPVPVVVDAGGVPHPRAAMSAGTVGLVVGLFVVLLGWFLVGLLGVAAQGLLLRRNLERWAEQWRAVEPRWSGRSV